MPENTRCPGAVGLTVTSTAIFACRGADKADWFGQPVMALGAAAYVLLSPAAAIARRTGNSIGAPSASAQITTASYFVMCAKAIG
jgi:hypothetical protein